MADREAGTEGHPENEGTRKDAMRKQDAAYCRYSSHKQDDGTSIEVQQEACRRAAGGEIQEYIDRAKTGRTTGGRHELLRLMQDCEDGKIGRIFVYKYDRLGRHSETHSLVASFEEQGAEVISVTEGRDSLARGVQLVVGEHYSKQLSERVTASLWKRFEQRTWTGGMPPFGYKVETCPDKRKRLAINEPEAKIVRTIFNLYQADSIGCKEIARRLAQKGLPTRLGAPWSFTTVRMILINRMLIGEVRFGKRKMKLNRVTGRRIPKYLDPSQHKVYIDESLRIITDEQFKRVEKKFAERQKNRGVTRARKSVRPFTGLLYCGACNSVYYAQKDSRTQRHYYTCAKRQREGVKQCSDSCLVREDQLLADVSGVFKGVFADAALVVDGIIKRAEQLATDNRDESTRIRKQISETDKLLTNYYRLLADPEIEPVVRNGLSRQIGMEEAKLVELRAALEAVTLRTEQGADRMIREARRAFEEARETFESIGSDAELHSFVESFVGPMVVGTDGQIRQLETKTPPVASGGVLNSIIAATGFDTVQAVVRTSFWTAYASAA